MSTVKHHLNFISSTANDTCLHIHKQEPNSILTFSLGLLERLQYSSLTLKLLLDKMEKELMYEFSAGILVRAILLDTLIGMNLYKLMKDAEEVGKSAVDMQAAVTEFSETILSGICQLGTGRR